MRTMDDGRWGIKIVGWVESNGMRGKQTSCGPAPRRLPSNEPPGPQQPQHCTSICTNLQPAPRCSPGFHPTVHFRFSIPPSVVQSSNGPPSLTFFLSFISQVHFQPSPSQRQQPPDHVNAAAPVPWRTIRGWGRRGRFGLWICQCFKRYFWNHRGVNQRGVASRCSSRMWELLSISSRSATHTTSPRSNGNGCRLSALPRRLKHSSILLLPAVHGQTQRRPELGVYGEGGEHGDTREKLTSPHGL